MTTLQATQNGYKSLTKAKGIDKPEPTPAPPAKYLELDDQDNVYLPNMNVVYWKHSLMNEFFPSEKKPEIQNKLFELVKENKMLSVYNDLCQSLGVEKDDKLIEEWKEFHEHELKMIEQAEKYSVESLGDSEVRDQLMRRAHFLCEIGEFEKAKEAYYVAFEKSIGVSSKLHVTLTLIRIGVAMRDHDLIKSEVKRSKDLLDKGGDWERKNKLKIYEAMYLVMTGNFEAASALIVGGLSTFSATEFIDFDKFILYAVSLATISESRQKYKECIIDSPEVHQVGAEDDVFKTFAESFYTSNFDQGFLALLDIAERLKADFFFGAHINKYLMKLRIKCYRSFLQPFKNVKISTMAKRFGVTPEFIEAEVSQFISSGHIQCRIDRVEGVIYAYSEQEVLADRILEEGEILQTKIQKLSRIMFM